MIETNGVKNILEELMWENVQNDKSDEEDVKNVVFIILHFNIRILISDFIKELEVTVGKSNVVNDKVEDVSIIVTNN